MCVCVWGGGGQVSGVCGGGRVSGGGERAADGWTVEMCLRLCLGVGVGGGVGGGWGVWWGAVCCACVVASACVHWRCVCLPCV